MWWWWTREGISLRPGRVQQCLSSQNGSPGSKLLDAQFFFKQKTAYEIRLSLVGSEMCIRDRGVVDAEGLIYGTRCGKAMFEGSTPMYRGGATRRRNRHVHPMSSFVVVSRER